MMGRDRARFVAGSFGLGIALSGLLIFLGQMYRAISSGHLEAVPVRSVLNEPLVRANIPTTVSEWLQHLFSSVEIDGLVAWLVDEVPLAAVLVVVGGVVAWRCLVWEPPASQRR
jgi:hypothetical protein